MRHERTDTTMIEMMRRIPSPARLRLLCIDLAKPRKMETSTGAWSCSRGSMRHKGWHALASMPDSIPHLFRVYCLPFCHWSFYQKNTFRFHKQTLSCVFIWPNWIQVLVKYMHYSQGICLLTPVNNNLCSWNQFYMQKLKIILKIICIIWIF